MKVSRDLPTITGEVVDEVIDRKNRPPEPMNPVVFIDVLHIEIRDAGTVKDKAVYLAGGRHPAQRQACATRSPDGRARLFAP